MNMAAKKMGLSRHRNLTGKTWTRTMAGRRGAIPNSPPPVKTGRVSVPTAKALFWNKNGDGGLISVAVTCSPATKARLVSCPQDNRQPGCLHMSPSGRAETAMATGRAPGNDGC